VALGVLATATGCTSMSLERHALSQIQSSGEYRYKATLDCLATVAANANALPSFSLLSTGSAKVTDTATVSSATSWTRSLGSFSTEGLGVIASRNPNELWTVDPSAEYPQLAALRSACQWVLYGAERANLDFPGILDSPVNNPMPGHHFGVADRLQQLPCGWLHVGRMTDVPLAACYKAHRGNTWVWVNSEGMKGLADFTLVLLDVATLDLNDGDASLTPPVLVSLIRQPSAFYMFPDDKWEDLKSKMKEKGISDTLIDDLRKHQFPMGQLFSQHDLDYAFQQSSYWSGVLIKNSDPTKQPNFQRDPVYQILLNAKSNKPSVFPDSQFFMEYRVIRPERWGEVSHMIQTAKSNQDRIDIPWEEWSTPYHNQRTAAKQNTAKAPTAGAGQNPPPTRDANQLLAPHIGPGLITIPGSSGPLITIPGSSKE